MAAASQAKPAGGHGHHNLTFGENLLAGGTAGVVECLIMYPLDVVKTLQQLKVGQGESTMKILADLFRREGFGVYRGIASPLLMETPKRAIKFTANNYFRTLYANKDSGKLNMFSAICAGMCAGLTEAFIVVPFELVKIRMQDRSNMNRYTSSGDAVVKIAKEEGILTFYKGLESTLWRNGVWNGAYFGTMHAFNTYMPAQGEWKTGYKNSLRNFAIGCVGGILATTLNTPFDVVKSRFQNSATATPWTWSGVLSVLKAEGARALWKGYGPKVLRLGPGGGILNVVHSYVAGLLIARKQTHQSSH